jgi:transcriptional regulator with XRE-family HTH domain
MEDVAIRAGVNRTYIPLIERGKVNPSVEVLFHILDVFDIPLWKFLRFVDVELSTGKLTFRDRLKIGDSTKEAPKGEKPPLEDFETHRSRVMGKYIGSFLRRKRLKERISQVELSTKSGLHRSTIGKIEVGECDVTSTNLDLICQVIGMKLWEFIRSVQTEMNLGVLVIPDQYPLPTSVRGSRKSTESISEISDKGSI